MMNKTVSTKLLHQRLEHPEKMRLTKLKNIIKDLEIIDMKDLSDFKDCKICVKIKKTKLQQHTAVTRATQPLERVHMDY